jgi:diketogulonate reductase-like aldo/keto reductase
MPLPPVPNFLYGTAWKEDRTAALTELAIRAGFRGIDTANQRRHYFEAGVGQGLVAAYNAGIVTRDELFLQTKFTYQPGQDHRLPYDPAASLAEQVKQSMASSLEHLDTDHVDSYVLHGPSSNLGWTDADTEVWQAMLQERDAGRTRLLGVSNVSLRHLEQMIAANQEVLRHPLVIQLAESLSATAAQVIFAFARAVGMLPLTGTSDPNHIQQDLASLNLTLTPDAVRVIEGIAG